MTPRYDPDDELVDEGPGRSGLLATPIVCPACTGSGQVLETPARQVGVSTDGRPILARTRCGRCRGSGVTGWKGQT